MKLSKIYSNQSKFKTIKFNDGFNVIYGDIIDEQTEGKVEEHNLGKTSLVHLIDFMLLKKIDSTSFLVEFADKFLNWEFYLEVKLNDTSYVTIRRSVGNYNQVSFKSHPLPDQDFVDEEDWDYSNLPIHSKDPLKSPQIIFENEYLRFDIQKKYGFRSFLGYLLRTQDDYTDVFRLNSFKGADANWKPQLLEIFGYTAELLYQKYALEDEISVAKKLIGKLNPDNEDKKYEIRAAISTKEEERRAIQKQLDEFSFYQKDDTVNQELVDNVESKIALLNDRKYAISYEIDQISTSLSLDKPQEVQESDLREFFDEIEVHFPESLQKDYADVINFTRQLSEERQLYLKDELKEQKAKLRTINTELMSLDEERSKLLTSLIQKSSFRKFKDYQASLSDVDNQIFNYKQQLRDIDRIELFREEQEARKVELKEIAKRMEAMLESDPREYLEIRRMFTHIYKTVFEYTGTLAVKLNKNNNVEFQPIVLDAGESLTGKSQGNTSRRVMCVSFVLAVLIAYSDKSFHRFAYHDGLMEGWGDSHKRSFIKIVRQFSQKYDIQFITSMISSDVPKGFEFEAGEKVRTLSKRDTLFNVDF